MKVLAKGRFIPIGDGENRRTLIYDRDVARAAVLAAGHPAAAGKIFNVSDGQFHTLNEIITVMCMCLGRRCPRISVPVAPVRFAVGVLEDAARLFGRKFPIGRGTIDKYTEDVAVDSQRIRTELGFVPEYDLVKGWREVKDRDRRSEIRGQKGKDRGRKAEGSERQRSTDYPDETKEDKVSWGRRRLTQINSRPG